MNPLLNIGSPELATKLESVGQRRSYKTDETVFNHSDRAEFLPIVLTGRIKIFRFLAPGKEIIVNIFGAGEVFAIPPVLDGTEYPATAAALEESELLLIYRKEFLGLLNESKEFSTSMMSRMSGLLRETTRSIENLATASPEERVANILLWLAEKEGDNRPVSISLRRQDIAQIAGLATETTIRAIRKLADTGILSIVRGKIILDEPERLEDYCGN